ncbi:MAG TPA: DUF3052 domain-containing protein [Terriglobales bacterium]|nr:DUF3052 domain-containing protein [Terriglobales bacterium]
MAGYSGTPLPQKLGLAKLAADPKAIIQFVNPPPDVTRELGVTKTAPSGALDFALLFVRSQAELRDHFPALTKRLKPAGMLWVSWPKKSSGTASDLTEDLIRKFGLKTGLVDVKVCAISDIWSGLKFVVRLKDRAQRKK